MTLILCIARFSESCNRFAVAVALNFDSNKNCKIYFTVVHFTRGATACYGTYTYNICSVI